MGKRIQTRFALAIIPFLSIATPCTAGVVWFDETGGGQGYGRFIDLAAAYADFMGPSTTTINFNILAPGAVLASQYQTAYGVTFANTAIGRYAGYSTIHSEDDPFVETLTGYDGSYMPNGDEVVVKFDNNVSATPFAIRFDNPVSTVGAFVGMGSRGTIHSLRISLFDQTNTLVSRRDVQSWLWERSPAGQNYESFFAVAADRAAISRVEILNNAGEDFANALVVDNLSFNQPPASRFALPEPATAAFLIAGTGGILLMNRRRIQA